MYIPTRDTPFAYMDNPTFAPHSLGFNVGINPLAASMPQDPAVKAQILAGVRGYLKAWDPVAQKEAWHVEQPGAWNGGVLSTAGGLVFQGNSAGEFNAYNASNGATLWSFAAQAGVIAAPIAYAIGNQQFVAIVVGWGGTYPLAGGDLARKGGPVYNKSRVLSFCLGGRGNYACAASARATGPAGTPSARTATLRQGTGRVFHSASMQRVPRRCGCWRRHRARSAARQRARGSRALEAQRARGLARVQRHGQLRQRDHA